MTLSSVLFTDYRRRVLGLLLLHPEQSYYLRELARLTRNGAGHAEAGIDQAGGCRGVADGESGQSGSLRGKSRLPDF